MEIKKLTDEKYQDIHEYLEYIASVLKGLKDVCVATDDNKKYYVSSNDEKTCVVSDNFEGYILERNEEDLVSKFSTLVYNFSFYYSGDMSRIQRENKFNGFTDQVIYIPAMENYPHDQLIYSQAKKDCNDAISFVYKFNPIISNKDHEMASTMYRNPDIITFDTINPRTGKTIRKHHSEYVYLSRQNCYSKVSTSIGKVKFVNSSNIVEVDEIMEIINNADFLVKVPSELTALLITKNDSFNKVVEVESEYKKLKKLQ